MDESNNSQGEKRQIAKNRHNDKIDRYRTNMVRKTYLVIIIWIHGFDIVSEMVCFQVIRSDEPILGLFNICL
jgi:hypothetical protein